MSKCKNSAGASPMTADDLDFFHTKKWFREILNHSPKNNTTRQRRISDATANRIESLLEVCDTINDNTDETTKVSVQKTVRFGKEEVERRLEAKGQCAELTEKLHDFNERTFLLRFGDYAGNFLNRLRSNLIINDTKASATHQDRNSRSESASSSVKDENRLAQLLKGIPECTREAFRSKLWTQIHDELKIEEQYATTDHAKMNLYKGPMTELLRILSEDLGDTDPSASRSLLRLYAERNLWCHSPMKELLENRNWIGLAQLIAEDIGWLEREAPKMASIRHFVPSALHAVQAYKQKFFIELHYNKDNYNVEAFRARLEELPRTIRSKRARRTKEEEDDVRRSRNSKSKQSSVFEDENNDAGLDLFGDD